MLSSAASYLMSCAIYDKQMHLSRGLRSIPQDWSVADLMRKTDEEFLALPHVGRTTLKYIREVLADPARHWWKRVERHINLYASMVPNTYVFVHHETLPPGAKLELDIQELLDVFAESGLSIRELRRLLHERQG